MSDPVQLALGTLNKAANYGTGLSSYFIPLALWVGMMIAYMLLRPLNGRLLSANIPAWRAALAGWLPAVAIGVAQVAALLAVLHFALGLELARTAGTIGFLLLTTASFAAVLQCVNAVFGTRGRVVGLALLMLQLTSAGGTYPVQTSPGFFGAIHPYLPMTWVVGGLRRLISGGDLTVVWQGAGVLGAFLVASLALTTWAAGRRRVWTVASLHPELVL
jgi:putative membrane protein